MAENIQCQMNESKCSKAICTETSAASSTSCKQWLAKADKKKTQPAKKANAPSMAEIN